ncbi:MAG: TrkA family potassium uptake protein [Clostridiales bacterium]|jgi:trk system potassium uptake protein TrkA|nr:TrkA family potassium uptake protein [Clostridiales bacterium]
MKKFRSKDKDDGYTIIIGCGRLGAGLANNLSDDGRSVLVVDKDNDAFKRLSPSFGGLTLNGDATEIRVLSEANVEKASSVVAVTNSDNTNLLVAQLVKDRYGAKNVVARLYEPERACICIDAGIKTICPSVLSANAINELLN